MAVRSPSHRLLLVAVLPRDRFWGKCSLVSSLLMGELALSADLWMIPAFREGVDMPEGRAVAQRDKDRLEECISRSLTKLSKDK